MARTLTDLFGGSIETLVVPFDRMLTSFGVHKEERIQLNNRKYRIERPFKDVELPLDLDIGDSKVFYHAISSKLGLVSIAEHYPSVKLTINCLTELLTKWALLSLGNMDLGIEDKVSSPIEKLDPHYRGYDVMLTHSPDPLSPVTFLI